MGATTPIPTEASIHLDLLQTQVDVEPTAGLFPKDFNPQGKPIWEALLRRRDYLEFLQGNPRPPSTQDRWSWLIEQYLASCLKLGIFAFRNSTESSKRGALLGFVSTARRAIAQLFNVNKLFYQVQIFKIINKYTLTKDSTRIESTAELFPITDPTFEDYIQLPLPGMKFRPTGHNSKRFFRELVTVVGNKIRIEIDLNNPRRATVKMIITSVTPYPMPSVGPLPSTEELNHMFERLVWRPIVRSNRFHGTPRIF